MPRSLSKVQKQISKKRGGKPTALHENSRDARRLRTAGAREDKLTRIMTAAQKSQQHYVDRVAWFQQAVSEKSEPLTDEEVHKLVEQFIAREDDALAELKVQQRPGRPKPKAQEQIEARIDFELKEFQSGFWIPDLREGDFMDKLQRWGGQWAGLNTLKFVRVVKGPPGEIKSSSFPPKGLS